MEIKGYTGVRTFSATKHNDRDRLGEVVTEWLRANQGVEVVDTVVTQSSDSQFHCISITIFVRTKEGARAAT